MHINNYVKEKMNKKQFHDHARKSTEEEKGEPFFKKYMKKML